MATCAPLLVLTLAFCWLTRSTGVMMAFLAGFTVLSFAFTGPKRAAREMSYIAAAFIGLAPFVVLIAQPLLKLILHDKLQNQPAPFPSIGYAFTTITRDGLRLITGHGFETIEHAVQIGACPQETPQVALFQVWYELGVVGAWLVAAIAFFAFREIGKASPRISPFLAAGLTTALVLGVAQNSLDDWVWLMALGLALAAADVGRRGEYRTSRPSADELARI